MTGRQGGHGAEPSQTRVLLAMAHDRPVVPPLCFADSDPLVLLSRLISRQTEGEFARVLNTHKYSVGRIHRVSSEKNVFTSIIFSFAHHLHADPGNQANRAPCAWLWVGGIHLKNALPTGRDSFTAAWWLRS
jgi:hypothetical protein